VRLKDLVFISYAGMIRGAVAFGLVLRIDKSVENRPVIVTTALSLVVFTTVVLGSTVATVQKILFGKEMAETARLNAEQHKNDHHNPNESEHDIFLHPNEIENLEPSRKSQVLAKQKKTNACVKTMKYLDCVVFKPMILYNYDPQGHKRIL
jgi:NhaP-type Na+/H+ or K+/H+ antiporter